LCFGWIDGQKNKLDEQFWLQKFTPRRPRSRWSKINREKATALIEQGRIRPAGLREIERARRDGRVDAAYASPGSITVPDDFQQALDQNPTARAFSTPSTARIVMRFCTSLWMPKSQKRASGASTNSSPC